MKFSIIVNFAFLRRGSGEMMTRAPVMVCNFVIHLVS